MLKKLLAVVFLSSLTGLAFAGTPSPLGNAGAAQGDDLPRLEELKYPASEAECAAACRREGYNSYQWIAPKSCTCSGKSTQ